MNLTTLLPLLNFPSPIKESIYSLIDKDSFRISTLSKDAYTGKDFDFPIRTYTPSDRLLTLLYLLPQQYSEYLQLGIPEKIISETFRDVSRRASFYFQKHGTIGLSEDDVIWFRHIINKQIFQIGPLQFQPFQMIYLDEETLGEPYMMFSQGIKSTLPPKTPVINCHVPTGVSLSENDITASLFQAKELFCKLYPNNAYAAFLCYSWLLYPHMQALLASDSKIRKFAERFQIIGICNDKDQAMEYLHPGTSLFLKSKEHPERFGFACGIIEIFPKGENKE